MISVTVPIYYKQSKKKTSMLGLNFYRNAHFITNDRAKKFISGVVNDFVEGDPILDGRIHVHFKVFLKRKGSDGGNVRSVIEKYVLDAIKTAEYIADDNADIVVTDSSEYSYDKAYPRAEVSLYNKDTERDEIIKVLLNIDFKSSLLYIRYSQTVEPCPFIFGNGGLTVVGSNRVWWLMCCTMWSRVKIFLLSEHFCLKLTPSFLLNLLLKPVKMTVLSSSQTA